MQLHNLVSTTVKKKRRLGLGHGSGRGKTAGRGTKGQKARGKIPGYFEGGALPLTKRLPFRRGKGKNKVFRKKPMVLNIKALTLFSKGDIVDIQTLVEKKIVDAQQAKEYGVKILGDGEILVSLIVKLPTSKNAAAKIVKAGGKIER